VELIIIIIELINMATFWGNWENAKETERKPVREQKYKEK
jgi:hypothetical protein